MSLSARGLTAALLALSLLAGCQGLVNVPAGGDTDAQPTPVPSVTHVGRIGGGELLGGSLVEQPHLEIAGTVSVSWVWDDRGTGAMEDVSVWRPQGPSDYAFIGDFAHGTHEKPTFAYNYPGAPPLNPLILVKAINEDPANPLLKAPVDYERVWTSRRSGSKADGSFWEPVAPPGYVAIGMVANTGYEKPSLDSYRCVREDLCEQKPYADRIWRDKGSGAPEDVALFAIPDLRGGFGAFHHYHAPSQSTWVLKKPTETHGAN
jgi:hypothetical protein